MADTNPFGVTDAQARVMDAVCEHGSHKAAAKVLGIAPKTVEIHCSAAGERMRLRGAVPPNVGTIAKYLTWDRQRRGQGTAKERSHG